MCNEQKQLIKRLNACGINIFSFRKNPKSILIEIDNTLIQIGNLLSSSIIVEESFPYVATLYVNGMECAIVHNSGSGGIATLCLLNGDWNKSKSVIRNIERKLNKKMPMYSLEKLCDLLIYQFLLY